MTNKSHLCRPIKHHVDNGAQTCPRVALRAPMLLAWIRPSLFSLRKSLTNPFHCLMYSSSLSWRWTNTRTHINNHKNCQIMFKYIYIHIYTHTHTHTHTHTGAGHIIRISSKSWFISLISFKKWNLYNVYIHSTQTDIFQVFIYFNFDDYNWQLMKNPNSVSQKIWLLLKTNTKKGFLENP